MDTTQGPKFLHVYDLGRSLVDSGKRFPVRKTLVRRGQQFAEANGLRIFWVGTEAYVSATQLDRLIQDAA